MSDEKNAPLEFSAFDLMPDWAQESSDSKPAAQKFKNRDDDRDSRGKRGGGGGGGKFERRGGPRDNNRRQGGGGGGGYRNDRDRRGGGGGGRGNFRGGDRRGGGGDRRNQHRDQNENFEIKGLNLTFEPTPDAAKALSKHIQESVKAYPVADLAKMVANSRERYQIRLKSEKNGPKLFKGKEDGSAWLNRDEAVANFLRNKKQLSKYYVIEEVELEAPKGNFGTIAVCGFSGEVLGPPNHHEYQGSIARIHREKFSNMSLERYKQRIQMESGEEILAKWQEKVSKTFHYRLRSEQPVEEAAPVVEEKQAEPAEEEAVVTEETAEAPAETPAEETEAAAPEAEEAPAEVTEEEAPEAEAEAAESEEAPAEEPEPEPTPEPAAEKPEGIVLKTQEELERHFRQNYADDEIAEANEVILSGNISGRKLSQDLLTLLKVEGKKLRRGFPFEMFQAVCNCLEKEGLKFFKRGKKALHVSMVRPQPVNPNLSLTERIQKIIAIVTENPKIQTADVLEQLCENFQRPEPKPKAKGKDNKSEKQDKQEQPEEAAKPELDDEAKSVLADIRWLAMEGYIVEFPDTHLELGKKPRPEGENQPSKKAAKKGAKGKQANPRGGKKLPGGICTFTIADLAPAPEKEAELAPASE